MKVYAAINRVQAALAKTGITKVGRNDAQKYNFRGIDHVFNAISPLLAEHGLCILPRMLSRTCEERINKNGNAMCYVTVEAEFDLIASEDGSKHTVRTFGEAMDSGDKATNKAMSAAYKYAALQTFAIPTEGDNDTENHSHRDEDGTAIQPKKLPAAPARQTALPANVRADYIALINEAADLKGLREAFDTAYRAAQQVNDEAALESFTTLKDQRKAALSTTKEAA
jgi:hypothetical protein